MVEHSNQGDQNIGKKFTQCFEKEPKQLPSQITYIKIQFESPKNLHQCFEIAYLGENV
jgi:hypothetical protein